MRHVVVNGSGCDDVRHVGADVHFDNLSDRRRRRWMIRRWESISAVHRVHVLLTAMALGREQRRRLHLHVEIGRAVKVSVEIGTAAQATEEAYSRVRLQT